MLLQHSPQLQHQGGTLDTLKEEPASAQTMLRMSKLQEWATDILIAGLGKTREDLSKDATSEVAPDRTSILTRISISGYRDFERFFLFAWAHLLTYILQSCFRALVWRLHLGWGSNQCLRKRFAWDTAGLHVGLLTRVQHLCG
jgi:hypothetical protein